MNPSSSLHYNATSIPNHIPITRVPSSNQRPTDREWMYITIHREADHFQESGERRVRRFFAEDRESTDTLRHPKNDTNSHFNAFHRLAPTADGPAGAAARQSAR
jgi:hypothetical protein